MLQNEINKLLAKGNCQTQWVVVSWQRGNGRGASHRLDDLINSLISFGQGTSITQFCKWGIEHLSNL